jgi:hypothetical protein
MNDVKPLTGTASFRDGLLTITTHAKRGERTVKLMVFYAIKDLYPDRRVANPAYSLKKCNLENGYLVKTELEYHVAVEKFGPTCSCAHSTFRGKNSREVCKHVKAMRAVGLLPRG